MQLDRRRLLQLSAMAITGSLLGGCETLEQRFTHSHLPNRWLSASISDTEHIYRLLNRIAYGPSPDGVNDVIERGLTWYIDKQLDYNSIEEPNILNWRLRPLNDILVTDTGILFDIDDHKLRSAITQAAMLRAVYSHRQLYEKMVEFWSGHFNIYTLKGEGTQLKIVDDQLVVRKHALGSFYNLLNASAHSAAMLAYLDNTSNRKGVPNENYARELLELHTLGVDGGYTQHDVMELARCFTGWTFQKHWHRGRFVFDPSVHDDGHKTVLGMDIAPGGGVHDVEQVLKILAYHPSTANYLSHKLCRYFIGVPSDALIRDTSSEFLRTRGDIKKVVRFILNAPEIYSSSSIIKRPYDYLISSLRALNVDTDCGADIQKFLVKMGQPLFEWPMPNGYPVDTRSWTGNLFERWNFILSLVAGNIEKTTVPWNEISKTARLLHKEPLSFVCELLFGLSLSSDKMAQLRSCIPNTISLQEQTALLLMSPDFHWR